MSERHDFLTLGDFTFSNLEVPANIKVGGAQSLAVHRLVGGARVIDAMGRDDAPISWSGLLLGATAVARAQWLDGYRIAGQSLDLAWGEFKYLVVVREFEADYERYYQIPYRITCEVVTQLQVAAGSEQSIDVDTAITNDLNNGNSLASSIGDATLSTCMSNLSTAITAVSRFAQAAQSTINSVLGPLAAAQAQVKVLIASASNTLANVTTFGGVLPNNPVSTNAAKLASQITNVVNLGNLYNLNSVLGRMANNLGAVNLSSATKTVAGANLYQVAQQQYGDATAWTGIAKANGLTDPFVVGTKTLTIPANPDNAGGVLTS